MSTLRSRIVRVVLMAALVGMAGSAGAEAPEGFKSLFNGKDLTGWDGNKDLWSVQDGAITGETTKEKPTKGNTFLIWKDGTLQDFELRVKWKLLAHNSGIQFRSKDKGNFVVNGYQADMDYDNKFTGILYEEGGRGILVKRGTKLKVQADGKKVEEGRTAEDKELLAAIKKDDWNEYVIIARGNHLVQKLNGVTTMELTDEQEAKRAMTGILAFQIHAGPPMKVQFKDIYLKELAAAK
jgi:hypothetical protein